MPRDASPFTPGHPADPALFVGRTGELDAIQQRMKALIKGRSECFVVTGPRGIGKSSLARYVVETARRGGWLREPMLAAHCFVGKAARLEDVWRRVAEALVLALPSDKGLLETAKKLLKDVVSFNVDIGLFSLRLERREDAFRVEDISLLEVLRRFWSLAKRAKLAGLIVALDDVSEAIKTEGFAVELKRTIDQNASAREKIPFSIILVGQEEIRQRLEADEPSVLRIFHPISLEPLSYQDCKDFFFKAFNQVGLECNDEAIRLMSAFSSGYPPILHEIGDAAYWLDKDGTIDIFDAWSAAKKAADTAGRRYLETSVYNALASRRYQTALEVVSVKLPSPFQSFTRQQLLTWLPQKEKRVANNFLQRMVRIGVLQHVSRGEYKFANPLFWFYVRGRFLKGLRQSEKDVRQALDWASSVIRVLEERLNNSRNEEKGVSFM